VGGDHVSTVEGEFEGLIRAAAIFIMVGAAMSVTYLALEPYVRRFWPDSLLGWSRIVAGHVRDPRVGRDILAGVVFGTALSLIDLARSLIIQRLGYSPPVPAYGSR